MSDVLILSQADIRRVLTMADAIRGVEEAYVQKSTGKGCLFPLVCHVFEPEKADLDIKSGHLAGSGIYGLKLVSWFGDNEQKGLPALFGTTLLFDDTTGAAGAVGAKYLARKDARRMLMAGTGAQAPYQIAAMLLALPGIDEVTLCSPRHPEKAAAEAEAVAARVEELLGGERKTPYTLRPSADLAGSVSASDVIVTATPARGGFIRREWVRPGTHLSCVGADMTGKQELESELLASSRVFVDDREQAVTVGECELPIRQGLLRREDIAGEMGELIAGLLPGRTDEREITVFDSTGIALQDLVVSKAAVDRARQQGLGVTASL